MLKKIIQPEILCGGDFLKDDFDRFDYVFGIGIFNVSIRNYSKYFDMMIKKMISVAKIGVGLNFLSNSYNLASGPYHFESPDQMKEKLEKNYDVEVEIVNDSRILGESGVFIYKR